MQSRFYSLLLMVFIAVPQMAKAVSVQQIDSFAAAGDKCLTYQLDRYIWVRGKDSEWKGQPFKERYRTAQRLYSDQSQGDKGFNPLNGPWDRALVPVLEAQRDAILDALLSVDVTGSLLKGVELDTAGNLIKLDGLEDYLRQNSFRKFPNSIQALMNQFGAKPRKLDELLSSSADEDFEKRIKNTAAITAACMQLSVVQTPSCASAVQALLKEANFNSNFILPKIWTEFIRTKKLREGVRKSALLMLARIKSQNPGSLFNDFAQGFRLAGFSPTEAGEAAWKLIALYGNGGPNTGYRILAFDLPPEAEMLGVSLSFIGTAIAYLDFQQRIAGQQHYALPSQISGSCLTTKPYHLLLSAYFSRWLVKQGFSPEVAQSATFILNKGYQVNRDVNNAGGGIEKLLSKPTDHPTNQVIRSDLNLAAAGSVYGSLVGRQQLKPISIEVGLKKIQKAQGLPESLSQKSIVDRIVSDRMRFIKIWDALYAPNRALQHFQTEQK